MMEIRSLVPDDRAAWEPLWQGYLAFYQTSVTDDLTALTWARFHDPAEPMHAYGAFIDGRLAGITHLILHRSTWTASPYCYLQDLFTAEWARRRGVASTLIEWVYGEAARLGAGRVHWLTQESNREAQAVYDRISARSGFIQYRTLLPV
ncbi:GNAT family N-acetyltransferase [Labrys monachus]|uniref:GNAT superfamily N-acetyltransferase n=1 Tax=Labrys monachus TaxID=217067 RepID=A0ABU0FIA0_9HYPH|nr:GNAT family N-acetyltransferase [Labrys monachus]MDQ0393843.1 GNAT superfamily N-acetyltransferase [Labrys monachus]